MSALRRGVPILRRTVPGLHRSVPPRGRTTAALRSATLSGFALVAGSLLALPGAAWAEGMPQLDFTTPLTLSQVWWGAGIFIVLYIVLSRVGLP